MSYELRSARFLAAEMLERIIEPGDTVVDATLGNGHDTCMLARMVGENGHVIGFDIQPDAVASAQSRLEQEGLLTRCELHVLGHQHMAEVVKEPVRTVTFNLGWLPGGDKSITTHWETTRQALDAALALLLPMGVCTICAYPGHAAGDEERRALINYLSALRPQSFNVLHQRFLNAGAGAPECFVVQKQMNEKQL